MSIRLLFRSLHYIFAILMPAVCLVVFVDRASAALSARAALRVSAAPSTLTFSVNSPSDVVDANPGDGKCETVPGNGVCTLRAAIMEANHAPGSGAVIQFTLPGTVTYTLSIPKSGADDEVTGDLNIIRSLTLIGNGADNTIIDGNGSAMNDRVFNIGSGIAVTMTGITIQNGNLNCPGCEGGGIQNSGALALQNVTLGSNTADYGGGIFSNGVRLTLMNVTLSGNQAYMGGGILNDGVRLTLTNVTLNDNGASANGGGIFNNENAITLTNSILSGNSAGGDGGGIYNQGNVMLINSTLSGNHSDRGGGLSNSPYGAVELTDSTLSGNTAAFGGGIYNDGTVNIINSTVSGNGAIADGGGLFNVMTVNVYDATITNNQADADFNGHGQGGGIYNDAGTFNFQNTILAANSETAMLFSNWVAVTGECGGTITSGGNNLMENYDTGHCTVNGTTPPLLDPVLGPLANNGGTTQTHALLPGSPAIDAGSSGGCRDNVGALLATDQRGFPRPALGGSALRCDIGAFEYYSHAVYLPLILR